MTIETESFLAGSSARQVYYEDGDILIRRFEEGDETSVKALFREGMQSNIPATLTKFVTSPFFGVTTIGSALVVNRLVLRVADHAFSPSPNNNNVTKKSSNWWFALAASAASVIWSYVFLSQNVRAGYGHFIQSAIDDDLSEISSVYFTGNGNFVVAIDKHSQRIVGCIGGHDRSSNKNEEYKSLHGPPPTSDMYEIRRMAVATTHRRRSVAQRLVSNLENSLLENHNSSSSLL
jgi:hypothetical protein